MQAIVLLPGEDYNGSPVPDKTMIFLAGDTDYFPPIYVRADFTEDVYTMTLNGITIQGEIVEQGTSVFIEWTWPVPSMEYDPEAMAQVLGCDTSAASNTIGLLNDMPEEFSQFLNNGGIVGMNGGGTWQNQG